MLGPFSERLTEFREQVEQSYGKENDARTELRVEVKRLSDLNQTVSREAANLASALKGQHFHTQVSDTTREGRRLQPDVVLDLPGERQIIIDAKVSLVAYERQC
ncbi:MAG: DNA recombination protein RmuC, partial [bacterium]